MEERAYLNHFLRITGCPEAASVETLDMLHTRVVNAMERHPFIEVGHDGVMAFMAMRAFNFYRFAVSRKVCQADPHIDPFMPAPVTADLATAITTRYHTIYTTGFFRNKGWAWGA